MTNFKLTTGILRAKVSRFTQNYVILLVSFEMQEPDFIVLSRENFDGLNSWVSTNYKLA
jgi:hypothetical protein